MRYFEIRTRLIYFEMLNFNYVDPTLEGLFKANVSFSLKYVCLVMVFRTQVFLCLCFEYISHVFTKH